MIKERAVNLEFETNLRNTKSLTTALTLEVLQHHSLVCLNYQIELIWWACFILKFFLFCNSAEKLKTSNNSFKSLKCAVFVIQQFQEELYMIWIARDPQTDNLLAISPLHCLKIWESFLIFLQDSLALLTSRIATEEGMRKNMNICEGNCWFLQQSFSRLQKTHNQWYQFIVQVKANQKVILAKVTTESVAADF